MKITHTHLIAAGMPTWDINKFRREWPDGCEINPENYKRADAIGLNAGAFFAAICPSKEMQDKWYSGGDFANRLAKERVLDEEYKAKKKLLEEEYEAAEIEKNCELIRQAMQVT